MTQTVDGSVQDTLAAGRTLARTLFDDLERLTATPPGVTRVAYGDGEVAAFDLVASAAKSWDAEQRFDAAGNQYLVMPGRDRTRTILIGSHLDSVPHGGNFDGAAGVILGLAVQASLAAAGEVPPFDLAALCLRAEESCWFPHSYIGSRTALGRLDPAALDLARTDTGRSLSSHMADLGFDPDGVRAGARLFDPGEIVAYIEPHIEQGPTLVSRNVPVGLVTGIRGSFRMRTITVTGEYGHSGATPRFVRKDAGLAAARFIVALHGLWDDFEAAGEDLTVTFGEIGTDPAAHGFSKIPGTVHLCLDVRSQSPATLTKAESRVRDIAAFVEDETGCSIALGPVTGSTPAPLNEDLRAILAGGARLSGVQTMLLPSGAGHDAATYADAGIPSAMVFIRNENGSHNPHEAMDMADFDQALAVVHAAVCDPRLADLERSTQT
ncbi:MAG: hydantoinase/carbamoylase family amidase [Pseudomonadota bacterium]